MQLLSWFWDLKTLAFQAITSSTSESAWQRYRARGLWVAAEADVYEGCVRFGERISRAWSRLANPPASSRWWFSRCVPFCALSSVNHHVLERSERPERRGKTPAELLTGAAHRHWLELLGFDRFTRLA